MPITLRMTFDGLCLFAPEFADAANPRLHALLVKMGEPDGAMPPMPPTPPGGTDDAPHDMSHHMHRDAAGMPADHAMPVHYPMLYVDSRYLVATAHREESGHLFGISLANRILNVPAVGTPIDTTEAFGEHIIDLVDVSGVAELDPAFVGPQLDRRTTARITFATGKSGRPPSSAVWHVDPKRPVNEKAPFFARLDDWNEWQVGNIGDEQLGLELLDGTTGEVVQRLVLFPVNNQIRLHVYCVQAKDLPGGPIPPVPPLNAKAEHFPGFYALFPGKPIAELTLVEPSKTTESNQCTTARVAVRPK